MQETSLYQSYNNPILSSGNSLPSASFSSAYFHSASASLKVSNCPKNSFADHRSITTHTHCLLLFATSAGDLLDSVKFVQNIDFIILLHSTVHKKNLTASTLKKEQPIIDSNCSPVSGFHTALTLLFSAHLYL